MRPWVRSHFRDARSAISTINLILSAAFVLTGLLAITLFVVR